MINDWYKILRLGVPVIRNHISILNIENILKISNQISIVAVKLYYSQNKSKISHLDFLSLTVQIVKSRLQNRQLSLFKIS